MTKAICVVILGCVINVASKRDFQVAFKARESKLKHLENEVVQKEKQFKDKVFTEKVGAMSPLVKLLTNGSQEAHAQLAAQLAGVLWNLAENAESAKSKITIVNAGAIPPLVELLTKGTQEAQAKAAGALWNLAVNDKIKITIANALVELLTKGTQEAQAKAAGAALWKLAVNDYAIPPLVELLTKGTQEAQAKAAGALWNLAVNDKISITIANHGAIPPLVALLTKGSREAQAKAAGALWNLAENDAPYRTFCSYHEIKITIAKNGAIPPLVELLTKGTQEAQANAAGALGNLAINSKGFKMVVNGFWDVKTRFCEPSFYKTISNAGAEAPLSELRTSGNQQAQTNAAIALQRIRGGRDPFDWGN